MNQHRYTLEPYKGLKTRFHCPACKNRQKTFTCYIDTETGEYLASNVGRCSRESNCGYHYTPKQYFRDNNDLLDAYKPKHYNFKKVTLTLEPKPVSYISYEIFKKSLKNYNENHFAKSLINLFNTEITNQLIAKYFIGTSKLWNNANVFWQIDITGKIRTGKIMLYNSDTGKRVKDPFSHINWVHSVLKIPEYNLNQCLFGEHLLKGNTKPVAIVESEKTAIIASVYLPQFIWLAAGSLSNLNAKKCTILKGRSVMLFPDLNGFDKWNTKTKEFFGIKFSVSDLLERKANETERKQGLDLADYLIKFNYKEFVAPEIEPAQIVQPIINPPLPKVKPPIPLKQQTVVRKTEKPIPPNWDDEIKELETYFGIKILPTELIKLNQHSTIINVTSFVRSHLAVVKSNNGKPKFLPYLERLKELKQHLENNPR